MLYWQILALLNGRGIVPAEGDLALQDDSDGSGPFIKNWGTIKLGALPTNAELDAVSVDAEALKQNSFDQHKIVNAMLDLGFIVIKLADVLIAKAVIAPADFDAKTRQEYQDLKALVDRLRP